MVGASGFEPLTTRTPSVCATRLRYAPTVGLRQSECNTPTRLNQFIEILRNDLGWADRRPAEQKITGSRKQTPQRFQIFLHLNQSTAVLLFRQRQLELIFFFFLRFFQFLPRAFDGEAFRIKEPLDVEQ
jgi:hypothetical protein